MGEETICATGCIARWQHGIADHAMHRHCTELRIMIMDFFYYVTIGFIIKICFHDKSKITI